MTTVSMARLRRQLARGFSLLELLVVVSILALIAGFGTLRLVDYAERRTLDAVVADVLTIAYAAQAYAANHKGLWPDANNPTPCQGAVDALIDAQYTGGAFVSPWADAQGDGYRTRCPLIDERQDTLQIQIRVPVEFAGALRTRLPSTSVAPPQPGEQWTWATHYLPLPRYHAGSVAIHEVAATDATTPQAACPEARRQLSVQPLAICLPASLPPPADVCQTFSKTIQVPVGLGTVPHTYTDQVCYTPPQSVRGYYTELGEPDPLTGERSLVLYVTADGTNFVPVDECDGQPVTFSVMEFCQ